MEAGKPIRLLNFGDAPRLPVNQREVIGVGDLHLLVGMFKTKAQLVIQPVPFSREIRICRVNTPLQLQRIFKLAVSTPLVIPHVERVVRKITINHEETWLNTRAQGSMVSQTGT